MEPALALKTSTVLLAIGAAGGIVMTLIRLRGAPRPPSSIAMLHGLLGAAALTLMVYFGFTTGIASIAQVATAVLVVAALIGLWLNLQFHSKLEPLPVPGILIHALVAVAGFAVLLVALFRG
jgi:hypothetical protein